MSEPVEAGGDAAEVLEPTGGVFDQVSVAIASRVEAHSDWERLARSGRLVPDGGAGDWTDRLRDDAWCHAERVGGGSIRLCGLVRAVRATRELIARLRVREELRHLSIDALEIVRNTLDEIADEGHA